MAAAKFQRKYFIEVDRIADKNHRSFLIWGNSEEIGVFVLHKRGFERVGPIQERNGVASVINRDIWRTIRSILRSPVAKRMDIIPKAWRPC